MGQYSGVNPFATFAPSGMSVLGGMGVTGSTTDDHPIQAQNGDNGGYKIPPVVWPILFVVLGYLIVRWIMED